mmetsp:Transcript_10366/g.16585  ORF Transcript_10366/g.16585 Transcript_10366/m.16585 type:complete len:1115 (+) Transcript_10366:282-3626(+)
MAVEPGGTLAGVGGGTAAATVTPTTPTGMQHDSSIESDPAVSDDESEISLPDWERDMEMEASGGVGVDEAAVTADPDAETRNVEVPMPSSSSSTSSNRTIYLKFQAWIVARGETDPTFEIWANFLPVVGMYQRLYHATQSRDWNLRLGAVKDLCPQMVIFDRPNYRRLMMDHLAIVARLPHGIRRLFEQGGFGANVWGDLCGGAAIDEIHEQMINLELKKSLSNPSINTIEKRAQILPIVAAAVQAIREGVLPDLGYEHVSRGKFAKRRDHENQVRTGQKLICESGALVHDRTRGLVNVWDTSAPPVTGAVLNDLTSAVKGRGMEYFVEICNLHYIQRNYDGPAAISFRNLAVEIFTKVKRQSATTKKAIDKSNADYNTTLERLALFSAQTGTPIHPTQILGQTCDISRALFKSRGVLNTNSKAQFVSVLLLKYLCPGLPISFVPPRDAQCHIKDAMHDLPKLGLKLKSSGGSKMFKTFGDVATLAVVHFTRIQFDSPNTLEVHLVFDDAAQAKGAKTMCQARRDATDGYDANEWSLGEITIDVATPLPSKFVSNFADYLKNRETKRKIITFLCHHLGDSLGKDDSTDWFRKGQVLVVAGGILDGSARRTSRSTETGGVTHAYVTEYTCNHAEADTSTYLHALRCDHEKVVVYSNDTDAFVIGMLACDAIQRGVVTASTPKNIHLQFRPSAGDTPAKYVDLHQLVTCVRNMEAFIFIDEDVRVRTLAALYAGAGCDYVSAFHGHPHSQFLDALTNERDFIMPRDRDQIRLGMYDTNIGGAFESFGRNVAAVYVRKNRGVFRTLGANISNMYLDSCAAVTVSAAATEEAAQGVGAAPTPGINAAGPHVVDLGALPADADIQFSVGPSASTLFSQFWMRLRQTQTLGGKKHRAETIMPTIGALWFHFCRVLGTVEMWGQWHVPQMDEKPLDQRGLEGQPDGTAAPKHDTVAMMQQVNDVNTDLSFVSSGCNCTALSGCKGGRCKCVNAGRKCGPFCHLDTRGTNEANGKHAHFCAHCKNPPSEAVVQEEHGFEQHDFDRIFDEVLAERNDEVDVVEEDEGSCCPTCGIAATRTDAGNCVACGYWAPPILGSLDYDSDFPDDIELGGWNSEGEDGDD